MFQSDWDEIPHQRARLPHRFSLWISDQIFHNVCPIFFFFRVPVFCPQKAWMSLILRVRGPTKPRRFFCLYSAFRTAFSDWDEIDFGVPFFFFFFSLPCQTQSLSPPFSLWNRGEKRAEKIFNCSPLIHICPPHSSARRPLFREGAGEYGGGVLFYYFGAQGGILSWDRPHLGKEWWWRIKGWGREIGVCVCMYEAVCAPLCVCVCVCV